MEIHIRKLGELVVCDALVKATCLNEPVILESLCFEALRRGDCNAVNNGKEKLFYKFGADEKNGHGDGVTGLIIIEESHFHISTWPEDNFVEIDINTCGHIAKPLLALGYLLFELKVEKCTTQVLERGVPF